MIGFSGQRPRRARLFEGGSFRSVAGRFGLNASYVAAAPGDYLICAWIEDGYEDWGPPASATGVRAGTHAADRRVAAPHGAARTYLGRA